MSWNVPTSKADWLQLAPEELEAVLRTIPKLVAYGWVQDEPGRMVRWDCEEYGVAQAASICRCAGGDATHQGFNDGWRWRQQWFPTATDARQAADDWLRKHGWVLVDSMVGPP